MLPIRLGMVNANGPQELFVYALTRRGRVETTNYRTVKLAVGPWTSRSTSRSEFGDFYKAMFAEQVRRERMQSGLPRVRVGHGLVRSVRGRSARRARSSRRSASSGSTIRSGGGRGGIERLRDAPPRPLRRGALPRGPRLPGDGRPRRTSRAATSCGIRSPAICRARPAIATATTSRGATSRRHRTWRLSRAGASARCDRR